MDKRAAIKKLRENYTIDGDGVAHIKLEHLNRLIKKAKTLSITKTYQQAKTNK